MSGLGPSPDTRWPLPGIDYDDPRGPGRFEDHVLHPFPIFGHGWEVAAPTVWPQRGDTRVGNDAWFGDRATVMPRVTIGDGAIVASAAVVTREVPPYAVVGGKPAAVIRSRFDGETVQRLLQIAWWDRGPRRSHATCRPSVPAMLRP